ncbi:cupin domain-containing protein [Candidatus Pelagibacter sp.]|nr:cupin domain-containing protein [Candidatus Pelagibacter sp.]
MIKKKKINYRDKRGYILDIFVNDPKDHCTLVTFNKNSIRGNHFHKKSTQYSFILEGKLYMFLAKVDLKGSVIGKIKRQIVVKNDLIVHEPLMSHAFKAITKSSMLAFANGTRGGKNYEKDTYRLKEKLT